MEDERALALMSVDHVQGWMKKHGYVGGALVTDVAKELHLPEDEVWVKYTVQIYFRLERQPELASQAEEADL